MHVLLLGSTVAVNFPESGLVDRYPDGFGDAVGVTSTRFGRGGLVAIGQPTVSAR